MNSAQLQRAISAVSSKGYLIVGAFALKAVICGKKKNCSLVLHNCGFEFRNPSSGNLFSSFEWIYLTKFEHSEKEVLLELKDGEQVIKLLSLNDTKTISDKISDTLQRILLPSELKKFDFSDFFIVEPTLFSALSRAYIFSQSNPNYQLDEKNLKKLRSILMFSQPEVDLNIFSNLPSFSPIFFNILPLIKSIESVIVPSMVTKKSQNNIDPFEMLSDFFCEKNYLKSLSIYGSTTNNFDKLLASIQKSSSKELKSLNFHHTEMKISDLDYLAHCILHSSIHSLGLHNSIIPQNMPYLYNAFLSAELLDHLHILSLDGTIDLDLKALFPKLKSLYCLSLAQCDLEVSDIFKTISETKMLNLCYLNISGNLCFEEIESDNVFTPPFLKTIKADYISWNNSCMLSFMKYISANCSNDRPLDLSLAHSVATNEEFQKFFAYLDMTKITISSFTWDGNPLSIHLFNLLKESPKIERISMNQCFSEKNPQDIEDLIDTIVSSKKLKELYLRGSKELYFGKNSCLVLEACCNHPSLEKLDITYSKGNIKFLPILLRMIRTVSPLKMLAFDGVFPSDTKEYIKFVQDVCNVQTVKKISFPMSDLKNLKIKKEISNDQIDSLLKLFYIDDKKVPESERSPFEQPFNVFRYFHSESFPTIFAENQINELKEIDFNNISIKIVERSIKNIIKIEEIKEDVEKDNFKESQETNVTLSNSTIISPRAPNSPIKARYLLQHPDIKEDLELFSLFSPSKKDLSFGSSSSVSGKNNIVETKKNNICNSSKMNVRNSRKSKSNNDNILFSRELKENMNDGGYDEIDYSLPHFTKKFENYACRDWDKLNKKYSIDRLYNETK